MDRLLKKQLEVYNKVTGLPVFAIDNYGKEIASFGEKPAFCRLFNDLTGKNSPCSQAHLHSGMQAGNLGEQYIYYCPGGLIHWTAPIISNAEIKGALVSGMVQMNIADNYMIDKLIKAHQIPENNSNLLQTNLKEVPIVDSVKVRYLADMLNIIAQNISTDEEHVLDERKRYYYEQRIIGENIHDIKSHQYQNIDVKYPVDIERELTNRVKRGDKAGAKALLNNILGYIFFQYAGNLQIMIARGLELLVIISRASIEGGAPSKKVFELTEYYIAEIPKVHSENQLSFLIIKVLDQFTDSVFPVESPENAIVIKNAIVYINEHYNENITLGTVADTVFLSHAYFSRLFKSETGMTFSEYINYVRIEESKKYLYDLEYKISEIATLVGVSDQSYYTKVFKKREGMSPGQFRRNT
jgi:YesN/AraC family two-component response regulator